MSADNPNRLVRICDCGACSTPLDGRPVTGDTPGAFCSDRCAGHAGGELPKARAEHREATS